MEKRTEEIVKNYLYLVEKIRKNVQQLFILREKKMYTKAFEIV